MHKIIFINRAKVETLKPFAELVFDRTTTEQVRCAETDPGFNTGPKSKHFRKAYIELWTDKSKTQEYNLKEGEQITINLRVDSNYQGGSKGSESWNGTFVITKSITRETKGYFIKFLSEASHAFSISKGFITKEDFCQNDGGFGNLPSLGSPSDISDDESLRDVRSVESTLTLENGEDYII